ncbi:MAG: peptide chain release factor N(5)-glutamine methyltransferase [Fibrobacteraceae bacterium]|nr:peptide chain release factor N(5)-glutamine methyltransferase [Fibrobacteraceae bacterium]
MDTVLEILNKTTAFFQRKGVPDPRLDAQYIISHGLKMKSRMDLYLNFEKPLTEAELAELRPLVARRANREPLQHIIGDTSFRGFRIKCDGRALIPRPETEQLVDMAKECLGALVCTEESPSRNIVEIGTGSGAISIACAKEIQGAKVFASDISDEALALARENAEINELSIDSENSSLTFAQGHLLKPWETQGPSKIHCIIANLPYIPDGEKENLQPEVAKFDPALALFGGADGLDLIRQMLQQTMLFVEKGILVSGVSILLEIGSEQGEMLKNEAGNYPWLTFVKAHKDYCDNIRFVQYKVK